MKKKEMKKRLEKEKQSIKEFELNSVNNNIKTGVIITVCVIGFILIMFVFTKVKTGEWNLFTKDNDITYSATAQTTKILCGQIFTRDDSEYYVLSYELKEDSAMLYETILERYNTSTSKLPLYKVDLSNSKNNICMGDSLNIANDIADLKLVIPTLLKIKDGKIIASHTDYDNIKTELLSYVD